MKDGERYNAAQYHFHAPSEHTLNGKSFAAEFHIVHKNANDAYAVVGILLDSGTTTNAAYESLAKAWPTTESEAKDAGFMVDADDLLPADQTTYRYSGSLTTPPCTEGVNWFLMTTPVQVTADQITQFEAAYKGNNRPTQDPEHTRTVLQDTTP